MSSKNDVRDSDAGSNAIPMARALAAGLNFLIWGSGYLYRRERTTMGALLLAGYLLIHWYWIVEVGVVSALTDVSSLVVFAGHLLLSIGFAYDVYTITGGDGGV